MEEHQHWDDDAAKYRDVLLPSGGMTLRDYFAAQFICGRAARNDGMESFEDCALDAYTVADAMLKAREVKS